VTGTLDFSPAPGPAPAASRVVRHGLMEAALLVRNGEQLLLAMIIPLGILVVGRFSGGRLGALSNLAPSVLALAIWSSAFTSVAISAGFERRYGVLERLAATPLGRSGLLAGKSVALVMIIVGQLVVLGITAALLGWRPTFTAPSALDALAVVIVATATFACLALLLAGRLRAEATLGLANLIYVVLLAGGALVIPLSRYPASVRPVVEILPTAALGEGLRAAAAGHALGWPLVVLAAWLLVAAAGAWKGFRWTS
jgi:ABC-2 type transport system permease protein